jgi:hypothetical protein
MPTGGTHNSENDFSFDFLERYLKDGEEFLSHSVIGDEFWDLFLNVEIKEQSK